MPRFRELYYIELLKYTAYTQEAQRDNKRVAPPVVIYRPASGE